MDDLFSFLTELASAPFRRLFSFRGLAVVLALALSFGGYQIIVSSGIGEELEIWDILPPRNPGEVTFYSGSSTGDYKILGDDLKTQIELNENFTIENNSSRSAGFQNGINVWQDKNSFGFVQRQQFGKDDYIFENIDLIAPVYTEQLHIVANKTLLKNKLSELGADKNEKYNEIFDSTTYAQIEIGIQQSDTLIKAILEAGKINLGTYGTGVMWIGSRIIDQLVKQVEDDSLKIAPLKIVNNTLEKARQNIRIKTTDSLEVVKNSLDSTREKIMRDRALGLAMFMIAPGLEDQDTLYNDTNTVVINLSPEFVIKLRDESDLQIRPTTFHYCDSKRERGYLKIKSLGTFTYLVTGKNTDIRLINKIIEGFVNVRRAKGLEYFGEEDYFYEKECDFQGNLQSEQDFYAQVFFGKDSINFEDIFEERMAEYNSKLLRVVALFLISIFVSLIPLYITVIYLFSGTNYWRYLSKIKRDVYRKGIPNNIIPKHRKQLRRYLATDEKEINATIAHNKNKDRLFEPFIMGDQKFVVNSILTAISNIFKFRTETYSLLSSGGLTETHYKYLDGEMDEAIAKLRKSLALRLNSMIEEKTDDLDKSSKFLSHFDNQEEAKKYLLKLTTADYLSKADYDALKRMLENRSG